MDLCDVKHGHLGNFFGNVINIFLNVLLDSNKFCTVWKVSSRTCWSILKRTKNYLSASLSWIGHLKFYHFTKRSLQFIKRQSTDRIVIMFELIIYNQLKTMSCHIIYTKKLVITVWYSDSCLKKWLEECVCKILSKSESIKIQSGAVFHGIN